MNSDDFNHESLKLARASLRVSRTSAGVGIASFLLALVLGLMPHIRPSGEGQRTPDADPNYAGRSSGWGSSYADADWHSAKSATGSSRLKSAYGSYDVGGWGYTEGDAYTYGDSGYSTKGG